MPLFISDLHRGHRRDHSVTMLSLKHTVILLTTLGQVYGQSGYTDARTIPQWLTGLIAVAVFLCLVLGVYLVNRMWNKRTQNNLQSETTGKSLECEETIPNGTYTRYVEHSPKTDQHEHAYDNPTIVTDNELTTAM
ncbi:PDZK1-interacting 1-like [Pelobates cultripes]|uniref:PDZK1-interacting 1-like n=1 Tax=Pelobates cultripes TaxID=61616 RepID=A0AAD1SUP6_PELCU|nr:PDZK1-interacting 1-like [Pelobates cultripes]